MALAPGAALGADVASEVEDLLPLVGVEIADFVESGEVGITDGLLVLLLGEVPGEDEELSHRYAHRGADLLERNGARHVVVVEQRTEGGVRDACALS